MIATKIFIALLALFGAIVALGSAFEIPIKAPIRDTELTTTTKLETVEIFESQGTTFIATVVPAVSVPEPTATLPATEPTIPVNFSESESTGVPCGVTLPGLVMRPCIIGSTALSCTHDIDDSVTTAFWSFNTTTAVQIETVTFTPIANTSTTTRTVSAVESKNPATGLCFWADQQILTPCTSMVAATATGSRNSAAIGLFNPIQDVTRYSRSFVDSKVALFKNILAVPRKIYSRAGISPDQCNGPFMLWSPLVSGTFVVFWCALILYIWPPADKTFRRVLFVLGIAGWIYLGITIIYLELRGLNKWIDKCSSIGALSCPKPQ